MLARIGCQQRLPSCEQARRRCGRTTVGIAGMPVEESARLLGPLLRREAIEPAHSEAALGALLKRCCDDIEAYYFEATGAQPALAPSGLDADQCDGTRSLLQ